MPGLLAILGCQRVETPPSMLVFLPWLSAVMAASGKASTRGPGKRNEALVARVTDYLAKLGCQRMENTSLPAVGRAFLGFPSAVIGSVRAKSVPTRGAGEGINPVAGRLAGRGS